MISDAANLRFPHKKAQVELGRYNIPENTVDRHSDPAAFMGSGFAGRGMKVR